MLENVIGHLPLMVFTTLGSMSAGASVILAACLATKSLDDARTAAKSGAVLLAVTAAAFAGSVLHVATPAHILFVAAGIGSSPLSNEVAFGGMYFIALALQTILAFSGKSSNKALAAAMYASALLGCAFIVFMGLAYTVDTIQSWNGSGTVIEMVGCALLGGGCLAAAVARGSSLRFRAVSLGCMVAGALAALAGAAMQVVVTGGIETALASGGALTDECTPLLIAFAALAACAIALAALRRKSSGGFIVLPAFAAVLCAASILCVRATFYLMEIGIGL